MSDHEYIPKSKVGKWFNDRLPLLTLANHLTDYPTPKNLNYWWTFGGILTFCLITQIVTGLVLAMHYIAHADMAFDSVEHIMRDVNYGWLIRYIHANGASMFFLAVYIHIFRSLFYGSYKSPREIIWIIGIIIYLLMMAAAFMGYVLPWGQMSFWGATVITNLFSAIPLVGEGIVTWLWGGYSVDNPTLTRFFTLHYLIPFLILGLVVLHIWALHVPGNLTIDLDGVDIGESFKISSIKLDSEVVPTIQGRDFVIATLAAPTVIKEPEKPAEAEAAEGAESAEGTEAAADGEGGKPTTEGDKKDGDDKKPLEKKPAEDKK